MNGEKKKIHFICSPDEEKGTSLSRPKNTTLDWKKIASIDIEKIIHTSNAELLEELLSQIAFCKAEAEFDSQNADSGFLKVFKLSQIIIEHLLHTQDVLETNYEHAMAQCKEIQDHRQVQVKEIQSLKETLSAARRELKRRKELLASAQSEVIGENKDEFDPCPYCSKRFLTSAYLLSHMQRRHQGLPLHPVFPAQSIFQDYLPKFVESDYHHQRQQRQYSGNHSSYPSPLEIQFQKASSAAHYSDSQGTQTEKTYETGQEKMSLETISALVEQCLREKSFLLDKDHDKSVHKQVNTKPAENNELNIAPKDDNTYDTDATSEGKPQQVFITSLENKKKDGEEVTDGSDSVKEIMAEIKHQLDLQWKYLSGKINQVGLEELKSLVVNEPGEVQGKKVIPSPNPKMSTQVNCMVTVGQKDDYASQGCLNLEADVEMRQASPTPSLITEHVEERFQKQQNDLVTLKKDLQSKMQEDMIVIESKLESQERYWRAKLRLVEDEYSQQFTKLREEFQASLFLHKNNTQRENESVTPCTTPAPAPAPMQWSQSMKPIISPDNYDQDQDEHQINYDDTFTSESPGLVTYKQLVSVQHQQQQQQQQQQPQFSAHENSQPSQTVSLANSSPQSISDQGQHDQQHQSQSRVLPRISMNRNQVQLVQSQSFLPPEMQQQKQQFVVTAHGDADSEVSPKSTHVEVGPFGILYNDPPPLLVNPQLITTVQTKKVVSGPVKPSRTSPNTENSVPTPVPVPKPRSVSVPPLAVSPSPTPPQDNNDDQHDMAYTTDNEAITHQHEYEEPDDILKLDHVEEYCYSVAEAAYDDDENVISHNYRIPLKQGHGQGHGHGHGHGHHRSQERKGKKNTGLVRTTTEEEAVSERMEKIREKVKSDINNQLESLGLAADGTEIDQRMMEKAIKKMDSRRESAIEEAPILEELRDQVMKETKMTLLSTSIQDRLSSSLHATPEKTAKSPLVKMMSVFKMSGKKMHRKVKSAIRKEPKKRKSKSPTLPLSNTNTTSTKKESKAAGFFSRARWGRGKNNDEKTNSLAVNQEQTNKDGSNQSSDSQSDSEDSSASSEPDVEVHYITKLKPLQSSTPIVATKSKIKTNENLESDVKIEEIRPGEMSSASSYETEDESPSVSHNATPSLRLAKKKLTVKDNKASKLRYREARKNSMAAAATAAELTSRENNKDKTLPKTPPVGQKLVVNPFLVNQKHGSENGKETEKKVSSGKSGEHLKKHSVRRSLQAEFDQVTPKNGDKPSSSRAVAAATPTTKDETSGSGSGSEVTSESESETDDKTDIESSSSWDEMADGQGPQNLNHHSQAGEYVTLTASKYTLERNKNQPSSSPEPENSAHIREVPGGGPQKNLSFLQRGRVNTAVTRTLAAESLSILNYAAPKHDTAYKPAGSSRPQTAKNRIVMDSWDTDDEDVGVRSNKGKVEPQLLLKNEAIGKPSLVSERWNEQPLYQNTNRKKIPMAITTTTTETLQDKQKRASTSKSRGKSQGHEDPTESPFNNSWDSS